MISKSTQEDLNSFPLGELDITVDADYPARAEIQ